MEIINNYKDLDAKLDQFNQELEIAINIRKDMAHFLQAINDFEKKMIDLSKNKIASDNRLKILMLEIEEISNESGSL